MVNNHTKPFLNTYHFVPIHGRKKLTLSKTLPTADEFRTGEKLGVMDHSIYHTDGISGRIECEIITKSPMVIGSGHSGEEGRLTRIFPYLYEKKPAIPATSLKGMLSSMIEAASNSAMRVFGEKEALSYRMKPEEALSAIGVLEEDENGVLKLRPLCLPTLSIDKKGNWKPTVPVTNPDCMNKGDKITWEDVFPNYANFKCYIGSYHKPKKNKTGGYVFFMPDSNRQKQLFYKHNKNLDKKDKISGWGAQYSDIFFMDVWGGGKYSDALAYCKKNQKKFRIKFSDIFAYNGWGLQIRKKSGGRLSVPGFLRILGADDRDMFKKKKHELFIPYPESAKDNPLISIDENAIKEFQTLANEMSDLDKEREEIRKRKPYLPFGNDQEMAKDRDGKKRVRLREGQLVYFDVAGVASEEGKVKPVVSRISFSAIWRKAVVDKERALVNLRKFFPECSLPFSMERERSISVAESMFGFVAKGLKDKPQDATSHDKENPNVAYKGKVRFSMASLEDGQEKVFQSNPQQSSTVDDPNDLRYIAIKALGSPKLPSPALYFKHEQADSNHYIQKNELSPDKHIPQGRKFYLARKSVQDQNWKTRDVDLKPSLKNEVCPIKPDVKFKFHIDFDNLTNEELDLLCFALYPSSDYHHLIGMGKSLGLGKIKITPISLKTINRKKRYSAEGFLSRRFDEEFSGSEVINKAERCAAVLDPEIINALTLMGRGHDGVSLPLASGQQNDEEKTFLWHAKNEKQQLRPIKNAMIPKLERN